jgi:hypothetical protein
LNTLEETLHCSATSYNACLVSILAVEIFPLPIYSLKELANSSQHRIVIKDGTAATDYFKEADPISHPVRANL